MCIDGINAGVLPGHDEPHETISARFVTLKALEIRLSLLLLPTAAVGCDTDRQHLLY